MTRTVDKQAGEVKLPGFLCPEVCREWESSKVYTSHIEVF